MPPALVTVDRATKTICRYERTGCAARPVRLTHRASVDDLGLVSTAEVEMFRQTPPVSLAV